MSQRLIFLILTTLWLSACINVYSPDIQQGNVVTQEMIDKLKPGMTRAQVRFVLGTPLVNDTFHPNRWDYVHYHRKNPDEQPETQRLTIIFDGDTLTQLDSDEALTISNFQLPAPAARNRSAPASL